MKRRPSHRLILKSLLLGLVFLGLQCEKKQDGLSTPGDSSKPSGSAPQSGAPATPARTLTMMDHAAKLGFVAKLPQDTELYLGSVNLKSHLTDLKRTIWWKDINALVQDKTPAPTAGAKMFPTLNQLWGSDFFIAGGKGFATGAGHFRNLDRVYNEVYFKMIMAGFSDMPSLRPNDEKKAEPDKKEDAPSQDTPDMAGPNPFFYLQMFLRDPATVEKVSAVISAFELPPLLAGFKIDKPEEILAVLNDTREFEENKTFVMSDHTTPQGHKFRVATVDLANVFTETDKKSALATLPAGMPEASRKIIEKTYDDLRKKTFVLAWGTVDGYVLLACGQNLDHLSFSATPAQSLLARPELAHLLPHAEKNLAALAYVSAGTIDAVTDDQPFVPRLRGAVSAMKESDSFKELATTLEKQVAALSPLESKVFSTKATNLAAISWWDRGLHVEATGGATPHFLTPGKPLRFHHLANRPGVVLGLAYHRNREHDQAVRSWLEIIGSITYSSASALIKSGMGGTKAEEFLAFVEKGLMPSLKSAYQADKNISEKALGSEIAYVLDLNGTMPPFPDLEMPPTAKDMKFPRLSAAIELTDRTELAKNWKLVNDSIIRITSAANFLSGQATPEGETPKNYDIPKPQSTTSGGAITWFYTDKPFDGDLSPTAIVSDPLLVLSTSKAAAESLAAELSKPPTTTAAVDGAIWRFDPDALLTWIHKTGSLTPDQSLGESEKAQMFFRWLKPFHVLQGRLYQEEKTGQWRTTLHWEMADVVKFD
jgi:hypothetical protein